MASKRKSVCIDEKVSLIRAIEKGDKKIDVAKRFGFSPSTVSTIWKNKEKFLQAEIDGKSKKLKKPKFEDLDQAMLTWFCKQRQNNMPVSGPIMKAKAVKYAEQLRITEFKASEGWLGKFKQRHCINYNGPARYHWTTACDVKVCRICFATDCKLYTMTIHNKLNKAYKTLTGLAVEEEDNLPSYLCVECAQRLLNCVEFRNRSLRAHLLLLETIKKHDHITFESLNSTIGNQKLFSANLVIKHNPIDHYDMKIEHMTDDTLNIETNDYEEERDIISLVNNQNYICSIKTENYEIYDQGNSSTDPINADATNSPSWDIDIDEMKMENIETCNRGNSGPVITNDSVNAPNLSVDIVRIKTEGDDMFDGDCFNYDDRNNKEMIHDVAKNEGKGTNHIIENMEDVSNAPKSSPVQIDMGSGGLNQADQFIDYKFSCELCHYQSNIKSRILRHVKIHAATLFKCNKCSYESKNLETLKAHKRNHSDVIKYSCRICKKFFNLNSNLKRHMMTHSNEKPYACKICGKAFKRQDHYKTHVNLHADVRPYSCEVCDKKFSRVDHYKSHLELHINKLSYVCDVCKRIFSRKSNLINHMNMHSGGKPFVCPACKKVFRRHNNLQKHMKLHKRKPYSCDNCKKYFSNKPDLIVHVYLHLVKSPWPCIECKRELPSKEALRQHLKKYCAVKCVGERS